MSAKTCKNTREKNLKTETEIETETGFFPKTEPKPVFFGKPKPEPKPIIIPKPNRNRKRSFSQNLWDTSISLWKSNNPMVEIFF